MSFYDDASLVLIPSGYKAGKVYSQKPLSTNGELTFTRASHATRVNVNGYVEKARTNNLLQSNKFDTTWSLQASASLTSGQAGYDGTNNAWLLSKAADYSRLEQNIVLSGVWTFSCYAKSGTLNWISFENSGIASDTTFFDLANGTLGSLGSGCIDSSIQDIGSGWYRCSVTISGTSAIMRIQPSVSNGVTNGSNGNIYIQDAQLEQGLVATDYIETTTAAVTVGIYNDVPRLDYSGGASCPALLLEPQRTNSLTSSEFFSTAYWPKTGVTIVSNDATSPEGLNNATKLVESSNNEFHFIRLDTTINAEATTFSFYAKAGERTSVSAFLSQSGNVGAIFDLSAETATASGTGNTASIESVGNDWYRCVVTNDGSADLNNSVRIGVQNGALTNYQGDGTSGVYIWGAQLERSASYPTSYIPTYGSTVTRSEDSTYKTGISSLIGQTEGTVFFEFDQKLIGQAATRRLLALTDGTANNRVVVYISAANKLEYYVRNTTGQLFLSTGVTVGNTTGVHKVAAVYKDGDYAIYMDGVEVDSGAGTAGTIPTCSRLDVGEQLGANQAYEPFKKVLLFTTRLSNADLATLTT